MRLLSVTAPARALIDVAAEGDDADLTRVLAQGHVAGLISDVELEAAMARCPRRTGVGRAKRLLGAERERGLTRSEAERLLFSLVRRAGLPRPETNVRVEGFEVDFLWRDARLVLEVDGYAFHRHRAAFETDPRRDQALMAGGYRVIRVTLAAAARRPAGGGGPGRPGARGPVTRAR